MKVFMRMRLLNRGVENNEFELMIGKKYGGSKHSFNLDDINDIMVLYAQ